MNAKRQFAVILASLAVVAPVGYGLASAAEQSTQTGQTQETPRALPKTGEAAVGDRYQLTPPAKAETTNAKAAALRLLAEARLALEVGDAARAEQLTAKATKLGVPESAFGKNEDSPSRLAWDLQQKRRTPDAALKPAAEPAGKAAQALHAPGDDTTKNQPAVSLTGPSFLNANPIEAAPVERIAQLPFPTTKTKKSSGAALELAKGEQALREGNLDAAFGHFQTAASNAASLDEGARDRLKNHLRLLNQRDSNAERVAAEPVQRKESIIETADADQRLLARQLSTAVGQAQVDARGLRETEPRSSLDLLEKTRAEVQASGLASQHREQLTRRIDRSIKETKQYIEDNRAQIELDEANAAVLAEIDRENAVKQQVREKIAQHVEEFNDLIDEQRFEEAEVVAKRLLEIAPDDPVSKQVWLNAKFIRRNMLNEQIRNLREEGNYNALVGVDQASIIPLGVDEDLIYGDNWPELQKRGPLSEDTNRSPREIEIERRLQTPVQLRYEDQPLKEVVDNLSQMAGVNIHLDPRGLNQEGVTSDTPVTLILNDEISLRSALNLILEPLHLGYTIKDEVLKITSESLRDGDVTPKTYYVADLVMPIPNFVPSNNIGLQGLINDALAVTGYGAGGIGAPGPIALANNAGGPAGQDALAQNFSPGGQLGGGAPAFTSGPGGLGGAANADFDSLIDLIVSTVASDTWAENGGGEAEIRPFPTNLSLVISQTQQVHEQIRDLLEQLRRLQDLQVTIEVRFIRLSDDFFERIGIDFDLNIDDGILGSNEIVQTNTGAFTREVVPGGVATANTGTVGVQAPLAGNIAEVTADLDIPFRQSSFDVALPSFGGFAPGQAATFGFAILSDIEAFFLIEAAQGDSRTNVLNAPKVTLFNGQQAFVSDTSQSPFVISVIPVVGEFAAAQQPVIVVLSEGTLMSIQAVVSEDRRYVRLTVVPFFSEIGDVDTFTFDGSTTTNGSSSSSSSFTDSDDDGTNESGDNANSSDVSTTVAGTTVQLPTFQFVSVSTTVSVPDGGTVLLGGIKRLREGREEFGIPLLSKVPFINRLFRNTGIGRDTDSLMMMVTPRIIIQEEEEERLGLAGN